MRNHVKPRPNGDTVLAILKWISVSTSHRVRGPAILAVLAIVLLPLGDLAGADEFALPDRVRVLPLFLVHTDQPAPTVLQKNRLMRHLKWSQTRFLEMLSGRSTFEIAKNTPDIVRIERPLSYCRKMKDGVIGLYWVSKLLNHYKVSRFQCPYIFCVIVMNPSDRFPRGAGRPINGGLNRGGGWVRLSSYTLDKISYFQGILQHELGHGFGLVHPTDYKYEMGTNPSIMAYNSSHRTDGFQPAPVPGILIPEDIRALAWNDRVFPNLDFNAGRDVPEGYVLAKNAVTFRPMKLVGHPDFEPVITTPSGEAIGSSASNLVRMPILQDSGPGNTFDRRMMWSSEDSPTGWVSLDLTFPGDVRLTRIMIHSQHSGKYNKAHAVRVEIKSEGGYEIVKESPLNESDAEVSFPEATARQWRLSFQAGPSKRVCLRGLQFFADDEQLFSPRAPYAAKTSRN